MKWHNINEPPKQWERIVLLCESGRIIFYGEFDGEDFTVWDNEFEIWSAPKDETIIAWMPQREVEEYLKELIHFRPKTADL